MFNITLADVTCLLGNHLISFNTCVHLCMKVVCFILNYHVLFLRWVHVVRQLWVNSKSNSCCQRQFYRPVRICITTIIFPLCSGIILEPSEFPVKLVGLRFFVVNVMRMFVLLILLICSIAKSKCHMLVAFQQRNNIPSNVVALGLEKILLLRSK